MTRSSVHRKPKSVHKKTRRQRQRQRGGGDPSIRDWANEATRFFKETEVFHTGTLDYTLRAYENPMLRLDLANNSDSFTFEQQGRSNNFKTMAANIRDGLTEELESGLDSTLSAFLDALKNEQRKSAYIVDAEHAFRQVIGVESDEHTLRSMLDAGPLYMFAIMMNIKQEEAAQIALMPVSGYSSSQ